MPDPLGGNVGWVLGCQFRRPGAAQILKESGPRRQLCLTDNAAELRPKIGVRITIARNHRLLAQSLRLRVEIFQQVVQHGLEVEP